MYIRRVHKRSIGVVFFMFAISVFFVLGFLANSVMTPPSVVPEYEIGWIFSSIGFMSEDEIFMAVDGRCLVEEDFQNLKDIYPEATFEPDIMELPPQKI